MKIHIPTPLRAYTDRQETVTVTGTTVAAGLEALVQAFPTLRQHLFTPEGKLRSFVNVYLRDEDVRYLPEKEETAVTDADEVTISPSIAGGGDAADLCGGSPNLREDMAHAQRMLAKMNPEQLLRATFAMEDILEGAVYVSGGMPARMKRSAVRKRTLRRKDGRTSRPASIHPWMRFLPSTV